MSNFERNGSFQNEYLNDTINSDDEKKCGGMIDKYNRNNPTKFQKDPIIGSEDN